MTRTSFALCDESVARELLEESESHWEDLPIEAEDLSSPRTKPTPFTILYEAKELFHIALPSVMIQFSLFFIFPQAASAVGTTLNTDDLAGFSLGSLLGNLTCLSIMEGSLTACDTLMPRAFAHGRYSEVAHLSIRAFFICVLLLVPPIIPLGLYSETILIWLGQDPEASQLAQGWIRIYFIGIFPMIVYRIALRFLLAQNRPWPHVVSSVVPCICCCPLLLRVLVPTMGLGGSALAISLTQWSMLLLLLAVLWWKPIHAPETWPGLSKQLIMDSLEWKPLMKQFSLALGGVCSLSEWWFWEIMCFVAGYFGVVSLCVHTIAYNLVPLLFMLPLGIMIGLAVRMGHTIAFDARRAQQLAAWCMGMIVVAGSIVASLIYWFRMTIILLFTTDEEVIEGCLHIWPYVCYYIFLLYIFGISNAIYRGLGMQWRLAMIVTVSLYLFLLPTVLYFAVIRQGGLYTQWRILPSFYVAMQIILAMGYIVVDWEQHGKTIRDGLRRSVRSQQLASDLEAHEATSLL